MSNLRKRRETRDLAPAHRSNRFDPTALQQQARWKNLVAGNAVPAVTALALVWLATICLVVVNGHIALNLIPLVYMAPVVLAATQWGLIPGLVAAFAGAAAADFFFYPPPYSFWLDNRQDVIDLALYLLVAIVTSNLAARLREEADTSGRREREIKELHAFSRGLAACLTERDLMFAVQDYLSNTLKYRAVLVAAAPDDGADFDGAALPAEVRQEAARLIAANAVHLVPIVELPNGRAWLVRVIAPQILGYGAIAVELGYGSRERLAPATRRIEAVLDEAMATLKHLRAKEAVGQATLNYQTEILRDALIGGVSHELRTPLASILGTCSVLKYMPAIRDNDDTHVLVESIHDQAAQLDDEIRDLLNASRISANGVRPQPVWTDPTDIVNAAVKQKARKLASHRLVLDLEHNVPLVHVDAVLVEQALGQVLENAAKYSPSGSTITIASRCREDCVELAVADQGSGLTAEERAKIGQHCYRGERHALQASGSGLGLWIAGTFIAANGGSIHADSRGPDLGTTMSLRLPTVSADTPAPVDAFDE